MLDGKIQVLIVRPVATEQPELIAVLHEARERSVHVIAIDGSPGGPDHFVTFSADNYGGKIAYLQGDQRIKAGRLRT